jgi:hypothetical protein
MATKSCCGSSTVNAVLERPRYYARQLITPDILTLEQDYFRHKQRLHNRLLHGWGVVCGLMVCPVPTSDGSANVPWEVTVLPGYALGPFGDAILVDSEVSVDLRTPSTTGTCGCSSGSVATAQMAADPWCGDIVVQRNAGTYWIAIKYAETMTRPERVQPSGCGCDDSKCENSRWQDCYEIGVLDYCPLGDAKPPAIDLQRLLRAGNPSCPDCPTDPWVPLAQVEVDDNGKLVLVDNCSCRRIIVPLGSLWFKCDGGKIKLDPISKDKAVEVQAGKTFEATFSAQGLADNPRIVVSRDVTITSVTVTEGVVKIQGTANANAASGPRTLIITNPDGSTVALQGLLSIAGTAAPAPTKKVIVKGNAPKTNP